MKFACLLVANEMKFKQKAIMYVITPFVEVVRTGSSYREAE